MAETVDIPGAGKIKKQYVYGGVAVVGVLAIVYYRNHKASASSSPTGVSGPSVGNPADPSSIDPATGLTYGAEAGSGFPAGFAAAGGGTDTGTVTPSTANTGPGTFTDNADWSQYAINYLSGTTGMDAGLVTQALGLYLTGQAVTASQEQIINEAIGIAGKPPVAGPGNFPPSIRISGSKSGGGPSGPLAAPGRLSVTPHAGFADFGWGTVKGATVYELVVTGAGGKGTGTSHVDKISADNHAEHVDLAPGHYTARARAGTSSTSINGKWTPSRSFTVSK